MPDYNAPPGYPVRIASNLALAASGSSRKTFTKRGTNGVITAATVLYRKVSGTGTLQVRLIAVTAWGTDVVIATGAEADLKLTLPAGWAVKELTVEVRETGTIAGCNVDAEVTLG